MMRMMRMNSIQQNGKKYNFNLENIVLGNKLEIIVIGL
jgi:hypothetical protein